MTATSDAWVRRFSPMPDAPTRLVCLPHAGGSASFFHPVAQAMAPEVEVLGIQYPGRQDRRQEPCLSSVAELADGVTKALWPWLDRPTALFGHSLGASVAFEVAWRLEHEGVTPLGLYVSGRRAPSLWRDDAVHHYDDDRLIAYLRSLGGTDSTLLGDEDVVRMILPALRGDYQAAHSYRGRPDQQVRCPVLVLVGDADPQVRDDEAKAWRDHTTGEFDLRTFPGGHFYLNARAAEVIAALSENLADVAARRRSVNG